MNKQRLDLFETLVERHIAHYKNVYDRKLVDSYVEIIDNSLRQYVDNLYKKVHISYTDYIGDVVVEIYTALENFTPYDGDWESLINRTNSKSYNKLLKYLKNRIYYFVLREYRQGYDTTTTVKTEEGESKTVHLYVSPSFSSIDKILLNKDDSETSMIHLLDNSLWTSDYEYKLGNFLYWFKESRSRILSESQCELLDTLEAHNYSVDEKRSNELKRSGINPKTVANKLSRIRNRVFKYWQAERKFIEMTQAEIILTRELGLLRTMEEIIEDDSCLNGMNYKLSNCIKANIDSKIITKILEKLPKEDYLEVVHAYQNKLPIISEVLYKIAVLVDEMIFELEMKLQAEAEMKQKVLKEIKLTLPKIDYSNSSCVYLTLTPLGTLVQKE